MGVQVLDSLEADVPQAIMVKFETAMCLCEILVALVMDILRNAN